MILPEDAFPAASSAPAAKAPQSRPSPSYEGVLAGALSIIFGLLGIFSIGFIFVPVAALCSIIGVLRGLGGGSSTGTGVSIVGGLMTIAGAAVSPTVWVLLAGGAILGSRANQKAGPQRHSS
ncbi:hypothetical protein, partial [Heyndrickxia sporothermodurans]